MNKRRKANWRKLAPKSVAAKPLKSMTEQERHYWTSVYPIYLRNTNGGAIVMPG